jgi:hypothetical protein
VNISTGDPLANEVKIDLDMFHDVVAENRCAPCSWIVELLEQLTEPRCLSHAVCHGTVLGLDAGAGDDWLPLRRPRDKVVP